MEVKDFVGKIVVSPSTKKKYILTAITSPEIRAKTVELNSCGYPSHYVWKTINSDPFADGRLVFEDESLGKKFKEVYDQYCHSKDAYLEEYGYWMRCGY